MKGLLADLRHALRLYRRTPGASLIAVVALAIGMAFVGAFLSLYVDLVLKPPPGFDAGGRFVTIGQSDGRQFAGMPLDLIERIQEEMPAVEAIAGISLRSQEVLPDRERVLVEAVSREFFAGMKPRLALGRGFERAEHEIDGEPVAVIAYSYWQEQYDGDPDVLGRLIELPMQDPAAQRGPNQPAPEEIVSEFRIVGVMAPELRGVLIDNVGLWLPFEPLIPLSYGQNNIEAVRGGLSMQTFARLRGGAGPENIATQLNTRYADAAESFTFRPGMRFDAIEGIVRSIPVQRDTKRQLQLFLTGSILLALVAACNVSLFLFARAPGRRRELGIRLAVGAPLRRLARQLATESSLIVIGAAALGLIFSVWLGQYLRSLAFLRRAEWGDVTLLDWRVLGLVGAFLLLLALAVSLAPILGLRRLGIAASSRQIAARATVAQRIAGTVQIAIAGTIGGCAIAFSWYLAVLIFGYPGYETRNLFAVQLANPAMTTGINLAQARLNAENAVVENVRRREAIESLPGVTAVTFGTPIPGGGGRSWSTMPAPDDPSRQIRIFRGVADSRFVDVLGYRLLFGRTPEDDDVGVAMVNQTLAREFFGREDVVGESLPTAIQGSQRTQIIGVLEDLSFDHPTAEVEPHVFLTASTMFFFGLTSVIESNLTAADLQQALQGLTDSGAFELIAQDVRPLSQLRSDLIAPDRARGLLTIFTAALVVFLAAVGFYGTQRYLVMAGRREYAIRASLGAGPRALGMLVFGRALLLGVPGLVLGALLAFIAVASLRGSFVADDIPPGVVTVGVVSSLVVLLLLASLGPAQQARRTEPAPLLKEE